jgi:quercetin dioxygenase-like cupin family protein
MNPEIKIERWTGAEPPSAKAMRRMMEAEGYSVFQWSDPPGTHYSPHQHTEDQSHCILSGKLELTIAGEKYVLQPGDRDFLPAGTVHAAFVPGNVPVVYLIGAKN